MNNIRILALAVVSTMTVACASTSKPTSPANTRRVIAQSDSEWSTPFPGVETMRTDGLVVLRVDPKIAPMVLLNRPVTWNKSIQTVAEANGLIVAINAAMFETDYNTSIGYMRNFENINNRQVSRKLKGFVMFNPVDASLPAIKIGAFEDSKDYNTVFQTHRMWTHEGGILWNRGQRYEGVGLIGTDSAHRALLFFHPAVIDMQDYVQKILDLNLNLTGLLYLDGGSHGALHVAPELGTSFNSRMPLPNIVGVKAPSQ